MHARITALSLLLLAGACASANPRAPRPEASAPAALPATPPATPPATAVQPATPPPARPVSSDPGVRTLQPPVVGALVAETEPRTPDGASSFAQPARAPAPPPPPPPDDDLGLPPAGVLPPLPDGR